MANIFHPSTNVISKLSIVGAALGVPALGVAGFLFSMSYAAEVEAPKPQPVQFSHKHHVGDDGIDCRYCHASVDKSNNAGMPGTHVCMTCHSQLWIDSPELEKVRASMRTGKPIEWSRVHDLPDFVYFNHSIHIKKGVSCVSCHGQVDESPLMFKQHTLTMAWCINCHKNPAKAIRPREQVFNMKWKPEEGQTQEEIGKDLMEKYHVLSSFQLTNCSTCHH